MQFCKKCKFAVLITTLVILVGLVMAFVGGGINGGFDFAGGSIISINLNAAADEAVIQKALDAVGSNDAHVRFKLERSEADVVSITMKTDSEALRQQILAEIQKTYPEAAMPTSASYKPVNGMSILYNALIAFGAAGALVFLYMLIRFGLAAGAAAVVALFHDVLFGTAVLSILRLPLTKEYLFAMLLVAGCSALYSALLLERIFEVKNRRPAGKAAQKAKNLPARPLGEVIGEAAQSLKHLALVTAAALIVMLCAVWAFTGSSLVSVIVPAVCGIAASAFCALFITGPVWGKWAKNTPAAAKAKQS
ncbi:MAG: hypothetical protein ACYCX2_04680 [Christensenellales bacterium]